MNYCVGIGRLTRDPEVRYLLTAPVRYILPCLFKVFIRHTAIHFIDFLRMACNGLHILLPCRGKRRRHIGQHTEEQQQQSLYRNSSFHSSTRR